MRSVLFLLAASTLSAQAPLTPAELRGKSIFERGGGSGPVTVVTTAGEKMPASILPCAGCHGSDGKGKPEGGVAPSDITWNALTRPYNVTDASGRTRQPYTERLLRRAFTAGLDASGNPLNAAMPRFQMRLADADDLVAYIRILDLPADPGVTASLVRLGIVHAPGWNLNQLLLNYFSALNAQGGIFGRSIDLAFLELPVDASQRPAALRRFILDQKIFAIAFADLTGAEAELSDVLDHAALPSIAAIAPNQRTDRALNRWVFYLDQGGPVSAPKLRAVAAAEVICEALRRAGRELTRSALVTALETFSNVNSSLGQPITFGPARRVGSLTPPSR